MCDCIMTASSQPTGRSSQATAPSRSLPRTIGYSLAGIAAVYLLVNVVRAVADPAGFAEYFGRPLADPTDVGFVYVYAIRSVFIAFVALLLLWRRATALLAGFAFLAVVMPIADAWLVAGAGAGAGLISRHLAIAVLLTVTGLLLASASRHDAPR
jgi:hypothetical protein